MNCTKFLTFFFVLSISFSNIYAKNKKNIKSFMRNEFPTLNASDREYKLLEEIALIASKSLIVKFVWPYQEVLDIAKNIIEYNNKIWDIKRDNKHLVIYTDCYLDTNHLEAHIIIKNYIPQAAYFVYENSNKVSFYTHYWKHILTVENSLNNRSDYYKKLLDPNLPQPLINYGISQH